jgi:hypothetical protein
MKFLNVMKSYKAFDLSVCREGAFEGKKFREARGSQHSWQIARSVRGKLFWAAE